ncbi:trihelix transcription factor ASIL1-like [Phoenix dactylifera]|uniref:Trihelix transcription factor ASIL1-like n=1 Tax=Phoenix dactylifera TaxID=42345 RepID=A0A8B7BN91_PHODC|nr:trihelix transcription factor ASIL1-like [Phoenix dactylifera]
MEDQVREVDTNDTDPSLLAIGGDGSEEEEEGRVRLVRPGPDRSKSDEWSEGAVASLLDAYEAKWVLRNRAKLKGQDWDNVARQVSARAGSTRPAKTPTQCKNKVESMKKRFRSESAAGGGSRWPLFPRLDRLVRCRAPTTALVMVDRPPERPTPSSHSPEPKGRAGARQGECEETKGKEHINELHKEGLCNMQPYDPCNEEQKLKNKRRRREREEEEGWEVMESIPWLAEVALRVEQARMDAMREVERMRAQAEAKKGEMDLKRTEIIANTQLKIAKLLVGYDDTVDSSLRIGRG